MNNGLQDSVTITGKASFSSQCTEQIAFWLQTEVLQDATENQLFVIFISLLLF